MKTWRSRLIRNLMIVVVAIVSVLASGLAAAQQSAPVPIRTAGLPPWVAATLIEKSKLGMEAIRQYLWRTRMIHNIYINDILDVDR